jgi:hypothetical protein
VGFIWFSKRTQQRSSVYVSSIVDQLENMSKEVLNERRALVSPLGVKQAKSTGIDEDPDIAADVHIDEVQCGFCATEAKIL